MSPLIQKTNIVSICSIIIYLTMLSISPILIMFSVAPGREILIQMFYTNKSGTKNIEGNSACGWLVLTVRAQDAQQQNFCKFWSKIQHLWSNLGIEQKAQSAYLFSFHWWVYCVVHCNNQPKPDFTVILSRLTPN